MNTLRVIQELLNHNHRDCAILVLVIVLFQLFVDVTILLDISTARPILSFVYLTFVPGFLLLKILKIQNLDFTEKFLFSAGLSVAFLMFTGLILNQLGLSFGLSVLSIPSLLLAMNFSVFVLCILGYFLGCNMKLNIEKLSFSLPSILTISFPLLAIIGTILVNFDGNSVILILMIGIIALTVLASSFKARMNWPLILFMITIAVLFQTSLISNYLVGYDVHPAYHVFKITQNNGVWNSILNETDQVIPRTNQVLSVTVLPTIYSNMLNLEGTWIFKIVYPLIFALVPVGIYQLGQKYIGKKAAFVASFAILADITFFYEMPGLPAQMIGEFFLVLLLLVLFQEKISPVTKLIFFAIFGAAIVVSHYGISYIFMILAFFAWLLSFLQKTQSKVKITFVTLFFVMTFSWYIYTSQSASFTSLLSMGENIYANFWADLFNPQSSSEVALLAGEPAASIGHWLGRGFRYAVQFFIVLGLANVVLKHKTDYKFDREYVAMSAVTLIFLALVLIAPSFNLLNVTRTYHLSLLFLSPFAIIGGTFLFSSLTKLRKSYMPFTLTLIVLLALFLFETGFIYEITGDVSYSVPLSMYRMDRAMVYGNGYLIESVDFFSAKWVGSNIALNARTLIYADIVSINQPLTSYAVFPRDHTDLLSNVTSFRGSDSYVFLRNFNTLDGKILGLGGRVWNTSDVRPRLETFNIIYSNGGSEIFAGSNVTGS